MRLFLDTNILIDLLADRKPFSQWAQRIFLDQKAGKCELFASSNSIITTYYILEKNIGDQRALAAIKVLLDRLEIVSISKSTLRSAMVRGFKDYEDAVQHDCALGIQGLDYIITRNKKDFNKGALKVLSSEELYIGYNF